MGYKRTPIVKRKSTRLNYLGQSQQYQFSREQKVPYYSQTSSTVRILTSPIYYLVLEYWNFHSICFTPDRLHEYEIHILGIQSYRFL